MTRTIRHEVDGRDYLLTISVQPSEPDVSVMRPVAALEAANGIHDARHWPRCCRELSSSELLEFINHADMEDDR